MPFAEGGNVRALRFDFLAGGGEMGALMRAYDWDSTPLGQPATWPSTLKFTLRLLLSANSPMLICWGADRILFCNDAFKSTLGAEYYPEALGQPGRECWKKLWHTIAHDVEHVMAGKGSTWREAQLLPGTCDGIERDYRWACDYSPIEDENGLQGVLVICHDVTQAHEDRQSLQRLNQELTAQVSAQKRAHDTLAEERDRIGAALNAYQGSLAQQVRDWRELHAMSTRLWQARTLDEQFAIVLNTVTRFHSCSQGVISLFDKAKNGLVTRASLGVSASGLAQLACVPVGAGACGTAFKEGRRIIVEDTEIDPLYEEYRGFAREQGVRALCSTPFFSVIGEPLGVLSVYFPTSRQPDERELRIVDICISTIALLVDRDRTEKHLHFEQERSHQLLQSMMDGFVLLDDEFRVVQINAQGLKLDTRSAEEILGRSHWEVWPGSEELPCARAYKEAMRERKAVRLEQDYIHLGRNMWVDIHAYPFGDGLALIYRDITEQKETQQRLLAVMEESERLRRLYETFLSHTPDLAYVFDLDHRFTYANDTLLKMWGKTWDEAIGKNCLELGYEPWHAELHDMEIEQVKATKQPIRGEVPFSGSFGRRIYDYIFVPVLGPDGEVEAIAGTTRDVTDRKQQEESLREANQRKDEFLAMLAHELRNPLAPISTAAQLLKVAGNNDKLVRQSSEIIARQVRHMTELVDDLLDVSRVTRGLVQLQKENVDIKSVVNSAIEQARPLIESRNHTLSTHVASAQTIVHGDKTRLVQVISNLLNNAAKYTPQGGNITLTVGVEDGQVSISVEDNGIGIDGDLLPHVFELFTQEKRTPDRSQGGLGLGLALVSSLMAMHGGRVEAKSDGPGMGSIFAISMPVSENQQLQQSEGEIQIRPFITAQALRILIVDDNRDAADSLASLLSIAGHVVWVEADAHKAIHTASVETPEVLILDIGLPDMNGYELARRLRQDPKTAGSIFIALTGYGQAHDRLLSERAGFDHHFVKPVDMTALEAALKHADN